MPFVVLHPRDIERIRKQRCAVVVDLRDRKAYSNFHYPHAINIPYEENECWTDKFRKNTIYILYCEHGNISLMAARRLARCGTNVYTVVGGIEGIKQQHFYD